MHWAELLLFLSAGYAVGVNYYLLNETDRLVFLAFFFAAITFLFATLANLLDIITAAPVAEFVTFQIIDWGPVYSTTLLLGGLILLIREAKPEFSRSPRIYAALPVILLFSYLLVYNISILKWWILILAQGGAIFVALLIYGMNYYYNATYLTIFAGTLLFLLTYLLALMLPQSSKIIYQIALFVSIVTFASGFLLVNNHLNEQKA